MKKLPTFAADVVPVYELPVPVALGYRVIIKPKPADQYVGVIATAARTQRAQRAVQTIGQIVAIGDIAFSKTRDLDLSADTNLPNVGDWVVFRQLAGQKLHVRRDHAAPVDEFGEAEEDYLLIMDDIDVLAKVPPEQVGRFRHWI